jgi:hypothetical protein
MADERQFQIRDRAGLEESKLNQEFVDFLRRAWFPVLVIALLLSGGSFLYRYYQKSVANELSVAFEELTAVSSGGRPNPTALIAVAETYPKVKSVAFLARLQAADAYMQAVRQRVALGGAINPDGTLVDPAKDALTDALREQYLTAAKEQYQLVHDTAKTIADKRNLALAAAFGLAAVAESSGNFSDAAAMYKDAAALAEASGDPLHATIANKRLETLDAVKQSPFILSKADLPPPPAPIPAPTPTSSNPTPNILPGEIPPVFTDPAASTGLPEIDNLINPAPSTPEPKPEQPNPEQPKPYQPKPDQPK